MEPILRHEESRRPAAPPRLAVVAAPRRLRRHDVLDQQDAPDGFDGFDGLEVSDALDALDALDVRDVRDALDVADLIDGNDAVAAHEDLDASTPTTPTTCTICSTGSTCPTGSTATTGTPSSRRPRSAVGSPLPPSPSPLASVEALPSSPRSGIAINACVVLAVPPPSSPLAAFVATTLTTAVGCIGADGTTRSTPPTSFTSPVVTHDAATASGQNRSRSRAGSLRSSASDRDSFGQAVRRFDRRSEVRRNVRCPAEPESHLGTGSRVRGRHASSICAERQVERVDRPCEEAVDVLRDAQHGTEVCPECDHQVPQPVLGCSVAPELSVVDGNGLRSAGAFGAAACRAGGMAIGRDAGRSRVDGAARRHLLELQLAICDQPDDRKP